MYGLIGYPLSHSFSPGFFEKKFARLGLEREYRLFPLKQIKDFPKLLSTNTTLQGLNVTIPYKQAVVTYLDEVDPAAASIGAVNCIAIRKSKLIGYNTDAWGFEYSLLPYLPEGQQQRALIFGTGGSSKAVQYVFDKHQIPFKQVSRNPSTNQLSYHQLSVKLLQDYTILVNTTPVGMHPKVEDCLPVPANAVTKRHYLFDLIYNPGETKFLELGRKCGSWYKNGLEMLYLQAEKSWHIWNS